MRAVRVRMHVALVAILDRGGRQTGERGGGRVRGAPRQRKTNVSKTFSGPTTKSLKPCWGAFVHIEVRSHRVRWWQVDQARSRHDGGSGYYYYCSSFGSRRSRRAMADTTRNGQSILGQAQRRTWLMSFAGLFFFLPPPPICLPVRGRRCPCTV